MSRKTICKTNIYKALRKSYDSGQYEPVTDDWYAIASDEFGRAKLYNFDTYDHVKTGTIIGCTSMSDYLRFATGLLEEGYDKYLESIREHYRNHPWAIPDEENMTPDQFLALRN